VDVPYQALDGTQGDIEAPFEFARTIRRVRQIEAPQRGLIDHQTVASVAHHIGDAIPRLAVENDREHGELVIRRGELDRRHGRFRGKCRDAREHAAAGEQRSGQRSQ
jgi:hypothetical protein